MTDRKPWVLQSLAEKAIIDEFTERHKATRAKLAELFTDVGEREAVTLHDHKLGTVSLQEGRETWQVVDEAAFQDWAVSYYGERALIKSVDPTIRSVVLTACKQSGGVLLDEVTGEIGLPDGVQLRKSAPTIVERTEKHAGWLVWQEIGEAASRLGIEAKQ